MKKAKSLFTKYIYVAILIGAATLSVTSCNHLQNNTISTETLSLNKGDEVYMFVYNTGDTPISHKSYNRTYQGSPSSKSRQIIGIEENIDEISPENQMDFSHFNCGLSLPLIRESYENPIPLEKASSARAASNETQARKEKNKAPAKSNDKCISYGTNSKNKIIKIPATCVYVNNDCQIFIQDDYYDSTGTDLYTMSGNSVDDLKITKKGAEELATKFSAIYKAEQALLGDADTDQVEYTNIIAKSDKITILLANLGAQDNGSTTLGYFYTSDLYCDKEEVWLNENKTRRYKDGLYYDNNDNVIMYSNERMMFTLNTRAYYVYEENDPEENQKYSFGKDVVYDTLGHEFNHMINFINKTLINDTDFDVWFTEMLSAITEDFIPKYLGIENTVQAQRLPYFLEKSESGMINWNGNDNVLYSYGYAYAFGAYLVRNYGGVELINELATNEYSGKDAITAALQACGYNKTYESVLLDFGLVLLNADGKDTNAPTLNKEISDSFNGYSYNFPKIDLYNFCSIYVKGNNLQTVIDSIEYYNRNWKYSENNGYFYFYGPCIYNTRYCPSNLNAGAFYTTYIGYADEDVGLVEFNYVEPTDPNLQVYFYVRPAR